MLTTYYEFYYNASLMGTAVAQEPNPSEQLSFFEWRSLWSIMALQEWSQAKKRRAKAVSVGVIACFLMAAIGTATTFTNPTQRDLSTELALARVEQIDFAMRLEATRAKLNHLRQAKAPTGLLVARPEALEALVNLLRSTDSLELRADSLRKTAQKELKVWRQQISSTRDAKAKAALKASYKNTVNQLRKSVDTQKRMTASANFLRREIQLTIKELSNSDLSAINQMRATIPGIDRQLAGSVKEIATSLTALENVRKSMNSLASQGTQESKSGS